MTREAGAQPGAPLPRLRPLDLVTAEWNGDRVVCARDHEGLLDGPVLVPLPIMLVAFLLDGRRDAPAVQTEFARLSGGMLLTVAELERIVRDLDAHGLLDSPALALRRAAIAEAYRAAPHRAMAHAGGGYPADAAALDRYLAAGASMSGEALGSGNGSSASRTKTRASRAASTASRRRALELSSRSLCDARYPRGILAPHIDFARGGPMYGRAYAALSGLPAGACIVVVGVAHAGSGAPYVVTAKGYETPFGVIEVDGPLLSAVAGGVPFDPFADEPVHRGEHSVEFQVVWLAHMLRGRPFTVLPVLTGPLDPGAPGGSPAGIEAVQAFIAALRRGIGTLGRPVCVVGGVDLSHVGPRFGDDEPLSPALGKRARESDLGALRQVEAGDAEAWWRTVAGDGNRWHVCGLGAVYTVLRLLAPVHGRVCGYDQGVDPAGGLVGFSAVVFE